ncbi:MAG: DUF2116 family Zn-ribbon domain-containing protein [Candidatus Bathyarchaeia archaeon]
MKKYSREEDKFAVFKHHHCQICEAPVPMDKKFCSKKCEEEFERLEKRKKYSTLLMLIMIPALFLIMTLLSSVRK